MKLTPHTILFKQQAIKFKPHPSPRNKDSPSTSTTTSAPPITKQDAKLHLTQKNRDDRKLKKMKRAEMLVANDEEVEKILELKGVDGNNDNDGDDQIEYTASSTPNPILLTTAQVERDKAMILERLPQPPEGKLTSKKRKRLEKFIEKQLKKEDRVKLIAKLSNDKLEKGVELLRSSKELGKVKMTSKEKLRMALKEHQSGIRFSDPNNRLFVDREEVDEDEGDGQDEDDEDEDMEDYSIAQKEKKVGDKDDGEIKTTTTSAAMAMADIPAGLSSMVPPGFGSGLKGAFGAGLKKSNTTTSIAITATSNSSGFGSSLKRKGDHESVTSGFVATGANSEEVKVAPKKRKQVKKKKKVAAAGSESKTGNPEFYFSSEDEDGDDEEEEEEEDNDADKMETDGDGDGTGKKKQLWTTNVVSGEQLGGKKMETKQQPSTTSDTSKKSTSSTALTNKPIERAFYVPVNRPEQISLSRIHLPVVSEEQPIMEAIYSNDVVVLCGETGSGKTTQVPQFLYEAGFGDVKHPKFPGLIGVTQPRRVAAVSMARRVAVELGCEEGSEGEGRVAYQIRYDASTVKEGVTRIKFMTDGILLRELSAGGGGGIDVGNNNNNNNNNKKRNTEPDLLLSRYSCIIIDEAHERTVGTDVLIGWLTRICKLRNGGKVAGLGPLKLVIMSATLRVEDFTLNKALFPTAVPPVVKVEGRQYKVTIHYNKVTPEVDYVTEALKKVSKIHKRLPPGGILVFLTGQSEITTLVRKLRKAFPPVPEKSSSNEHEMVPATKGSKKDQQQKQKGKGKMESGKGDGVVASVEAAGLFGEAEDGDEEFDDKFGDIPKGDDDYETLLAEEEDDEEEQVHILEGAEGEEGEGDGDDEVEKDRPLHVLPLYSLLPTAAQMRVFDAPPEGARLCVVATNVAETSLTIPGIKYVVDCGKVKEKRYESTNGVQTFQIGWTSKASADQRAGRAGRVGPGHCYRLFSSAVFENYFDLYSRPEILRVPIESVILQMKAMGIANVVNFPFPTPPGREHLKEGERLLMHLGALEGVVETAGAGMVAKITELGKVMAKFPVPPRYGKMLVIAAKQSLALAKFTIAIVAGLSVGDPFIRDAEIIGIVHDEDEDERMNDEKEQRSKKRGEWHRVMQLFAGDPRSSDALRLLRAIGAYSAVRSKSLDAANEFADKHFLRSKAMDEIQRLRLQLINILKTSLSNLSSLSNEMTMTPPTKEDGAKLRQILLAGLPDRVAKFDIDATRQYALTTKKTIPIYTTMWGGADEVFCIHASSCLASERPAPEWIVYEEVAGSEERMAIDNSGALQLRANIPTNSDGKTTKRMLLKNVTVISESWLAEVGPKTLLRLGRVMDQPEPCYRAGVDAVFGYCTPNYGPRMWELPVKEIELKGADAVSWFAVALLEGKVQMAWPIIKKKKKASKQATMEEETFFAVFKSYLNAKPSIMTKSWARVQKKVTSLLAVLASANIHSGESLFRKWHTNKTFLLEQYLLWLPSELHVLVTSFWPPVEFVSKKEIIGPLDLSSGDVAIKEKTVALQRLKASLNSLVSSRSSSSYAGRGGDVESEEDSD
ncbi:ATP-dependent RNA helicase dhx37 [Blyttiomyces sp. JEL0837]|nr:ATP-dependent RNA helicase dhx37 [Blyttiomyces sp. JEL0837]